MGHLLSRGRKTLSDTGASLAVGPLGRLDPRLRILAAAGFALVAVALSDLVALGFALALALALLPLSALHAGRALKRAAMMDLFLVFLLCTLPFTTTGAPLAHVAGFRASREGLAHAAEIILTANAVMLTLQALVGTLEPVTQGRALHALKAPERLVHLMLFTIRYVEVLREEYERLRASMKVRGFRPRTDLHTYRSFGYLVGMMLVRALERSERILGAMKCRGFQGRLPLLDGFVLRAEDRVFAILWTLALAGLIGLELLRAAG